MKVFKTQEEYSPWRKGKNNVGFVPTMGALHEGHLSLIRRCQKENDHTLVSIFLNPTQFNQKKDLEDYPVDAARDLELLKSLKVDVLFMPNESEIYPFGNDTRIYSNELSKVLCGKYRPGHFEGVMTVVAKLFGILQPSRAYFGLKDFQQFVLIQRMVRDLFMSIEVLGCDTVRDDAGLALSSRLKRLSAEGRKKAEGIYPALSETVKKLQDGLAYERVLSDLRERLEQIGRLEYVEAVNCKTLKSVQNPQSGDVIALALWIEEIRLIDHFDI